MKPRYCVTARWALLVLVAVVALLRATSPHTGLVDTQYGRVRSSVTPATVSSCFADDTCPPVYDSFGELQSHQ